MKLRLNPALDPEPYARVYAQRKFVQIPDVFEPHVADEIEKWLLSLPWRLLLQDENKQNMLLTSRELAEMAPEKRQAIESRMRARAASTFGYTYCAYPLGQSFQEKWDPGHPIHNVFPFLNEPSFLNFARTVSGCASIARVDGHATNFMRGHYLIRHVDPGDRRERRAAFTFGFSRDWQPDWGGLLLFFDQNLNIREGFLPRFNVLTIFDGAAMQHNVTAIAAFAPRPRLSFAGWFMDS